MKAQCKGIENDERKNGTIFNANNVTGSVNNYTCSWTDYRSTINDISIGEITKGAEVGGTTHNISKGEITKAAELGGTTYASPYER
jgi:hypothetical protein